MNFWAPALTIIAIGVIVGQALNLASTLEILGLFWVLFWFAFALLIRPKKT